MKLIDNVSADDLSQSIVNPVFEPFQNTVIPVAQPYLPDRKRLDAYIDGIYQRRWLTNNGPLVQLLTERLQAFLGVRNLLLVSNGTLALQIAYRALNIHLPVDGKPAEAVTTPFSFAATSSTLVWEGIKPVYADIDPASWCLNPEHITQQITPQTRAIVPVHVFGNICEVEEIAAVAEEHDLKVIYDGAHAFGVGYKGGSALSWGDATTLSFHATKIFHCIEGGAIVFKNPEDLERARHLINFGITGPDVVEAVGINAKMNEFSAAMGLSLLDEYMINIEGREKIWQRYYRELSDQVIRQKRMADISHNYAYYPVVFEDTAQMLVIQKKLLEINISSRRYFYPSLDTLAFFNASEPKIASRDVASRILCLPVFYGLPDNIVSKIIDIVNGK